MILKDFLINGEDVKMYLQRYSNTQSSALKDDALCIRQGRLMIDLWKPVCFLILFQIDINKSHFK